MLTGAVAQYGRGMIEDVSAQLVRSFADCLKAQLVAAPDAAAVAELGRFLGYRVTVCDARAKFVTPERFPHVDELVVEWPDRFEERSRVDERTAICVLTHDHKFDVPLLKVALATNAGYIGAMGSRRTAEDRAERLRAEGVSGEELGRIHAPIRLRIGARTPQEVAIRDRRGTGRSQARSQARARAARASTDADGEPAVDPRAALGGHD